MMPARDGAETICILALYAGSDSAAATAGGTAPRSPAVHVFRSPLPPDTLEPRLVEILERFLAAGAPPLRGEGVRPPPARDEGGPAKKRPGLY